MNYLLIHGMASHDRHMCRVSQILRKTTAELAGRLVRDALQYVGCSKCFATSTRLSKEYSIQRILPPSLGGDEMSLRRTRQPESPYPAPEL